MKVIDLIKQLQVLNPDAPLLVKHTEVEDEEFEQESWSEGSFSVALERNGVKLTRNDTEHWDTE